MLGEEFYRAGFQREKASPNVLDALAAKRQCGAVLAKVPTALRDDLTNLVVSYPTTQQPQWVLEEVLLAGLLKHSLGKPSSLRLLRNTTSVVSSFTGLSKRPGRGRPPLQLGTIPPIFADASRRIREHNLVCLH